MKILVTGANGYIGSKVVKQLCDYNVEVIATDFDNKNIDARATFVKANIFEDNDNWYEFFERPDVCLHLAWRDGFVHNSDKHMLDLSNHYKFMTNLIKNGLPQIAAMGTMHEVGYWEGAIDENTPCNPLSQYGIAKNALRKSIELFASQNNCKFQWLRAYYIFGDDLYGNSIFCKIRQAVADGKESFPFTTGKNEYDFIHVDELAKQISLSVMQDKILGIINVCSGKPVSLANQIEWYISYNKLPIKLDYGKYPDRPYDSPCIYGDNKKILEILNNNF
jgi:dTDP-6-deoxy-L-talose 4-dehydrogenase (NAD+)